MRIEEAIAHCEEMSKDSSDCAKQHQQLAMWLKELIKLRIEKERLEHIEAEYRETCEERKVEQLQKELDEERKFKKELMKSKAESVISLIDEIEKRRELIEKIRATMNSPVLVGATGCILKLLEEYKH